MVPDPEEFEFVRSPQFQAEEYFDSGYLQGDCDDAATFAAGLLCAIGYPCKLIAIRRPHDSDFSHVYCSAREGPYLVDIDPIVPAHRMPIPLSEIIETMEVVL